MTQTGAFDFDGGFAELFVNHFPRRTLELALPCVIDCTCDDGGQVVEQCRVPGDAHVSVERERLRIGRDSLGHDDDDGERGRKSRGVCQDRTPHGQVWLGLDNKHAKAIVLINPLRDPIEARGP